MRRTNINALLKMVRQYLGGETDRFSFVLDFPYEVEKRYPKMLKEDEEYADMLHYYLVECGTNKAAELSDEDFRRLMQQQYDEVIDGVY